ncbi:hypothetical protein Ancab_034407 [Ancistrocladus abbreviatus]
MSQRKSKPQIYHQVSPGIPNDDAQPPLLQRFPFNMPIPAVITSTRSILQCNPIPDPLPPSPDPPSDGGRHRSITLTRQYNRPALDGIVNFNSLFTLAVFIGLAWKPNDRGDTFIDKQACGGTTVIAESLVTFNVYSFSSFLFYCLVAVGLNQAPGSPSTTSPTGLTSTNWASGSGSWCRQSGQSADTGSWCWLCSMFV